MDQATSALPNRHQIDPINKCRGLCMQARTWTDCWLNSNTRRASSLGRTWNGMTNALRADDGRVRWVHRDYAAAVSLWMVRL